jgi:hypothetical protein
MAHEAAVAAHGEQHDLDAVTLAEVRRERAEHVRAIELRAFQQLLRGGFELGKVIEVLLDHVRAFLAREVRRIHPVEGAAVVELRREIAHRLHARLVRVKERDHRACGGGTLRELAHVRRRDGVLLEQRVGEHFLQVVREPRVRVVRERGQVDVKNLRELDQQMRRQRTLIVLDEVEIAGRDLQPLRELRLRELLFAPEGAHFRTELESGSHVVPPERLTGCSRVSG